MLEFFIIGFIILMVYRCEISPRNLFYNDYLTSKQTTFLRGILAITIIFHHLFDYTERSNVSTIFRNSGHLVVAIFFFLSGYGLLISYQEKGRHYLKKLALCKIPELLLVFIVIGFLYMIIESLLGTKVNWGTELVKLFGPNSIVTYSWFITMICILYLLFFLSYWICKEHYLYGTIIICLAIFGIMFFLYNIDVGEWWFVSLLAFPMGIIWAIKEKEIFSFCTKRYWLKLLSLLCVYRVSFVLAIYGEFTRFREIPYLNIGNLTLSSLIFTVIIIMLCMKIKIRNSIFCKLGTISLEIYLFQGMWIHILIKYKMLINNELILIPVIMSGILITAFIFSALKNRGLKKIEKAIIKYNYKGTKNRD